METNKNGDFAREWTVENLWLKKFGLIYSWDCPIWVTNKMVTLLGTLHRVFHVFLWFHGWAMLPCHRTQIILPYRVMSLLSPSLVSWVNSHRCCWIICCNSSFNVSSVRFVLFPNYFIIPHKLWVESLRSLHQCVLFEEEMRKNQSICNRDEADLSSCDEVTLQVEDGIHMMQYDDKEVL